MSSHGPLNRKKKMWVWRNQRDGNVGTTEKDSLGVASRRGQGKWVASGSWKR